ncbi:hypothetical protein T484DRAFT_3040962 [Baffinella frigidus]|nr:hypothetical protein T484DRAFT_3040962 [Cryptophyta sp. CCMP2293]
MISGAMLAGKVAIVTGAGRGIGKAAAKLLAKHGAYVVVNDLSPEEAYATRKEIEVSGGRALAVAGSVTAPGFPEELVQV